MDTQVGCRPIRRLTTHSHRQFTRPLDQRPATERDFLGDAHRAQIQDVLLHAYSVGVVAGETRSGKQAADDSPILPGILAAIGNGLRNG